jgi:hypothetical protein
MYYTYTVAIMDGVVLPDDVTLRDTREALEVAEQSGEDVAVSLARWNLGVALLHRGSTAAAVEGVELLTQVRETTMQGRYSMTGVHNVDIEIARERLVAGDLDRAVELSRAVIEGLTEAGSHVWIPVATAICAEALFRRRRNGDFERATAAIDRMAAVPTASGVVLQDIFLLRLQALSVDARGDEVAHRDLRGSLPRDGH